MSCVMRHVCEEHNFIMSIQLRTSYCNRNLCWKFEHWFFKNYYLGFLILFDFRDSHIWKVRRIVVIVSFLISEFAQFFLKQISKNNSST